MYRVCNIVLLPVGLPKDLFVIVMSYVLPIFLAFLDKSKKCNEISFRCPKISATEQKAGVYISASQKYRYPPRPKIDLLVTRYEYNLKKNPYSLPNSTDNL
jgi:hypothetical protein